MNKLWSKISLRWLSLAFLLLSLAGFADALYLSSVYFDNSNPVCFNISHCDRVIASEYSTMGSIPVSVIGAIYYFVILILVFVLFWSKWKSSPEIINWLALLTGAGFLVSLWLVYLQLFVIQAICIYCMASAGISSMLFGLSLLVSNFKKRAVLNPEKIQNGE